MAFLIGGANSAADTEPYDIDNSLRFATGDSAYLSFTTGTPTSVRKATWSFWHKKTRDTTEVIFGSDADYMEIYSEGGGELSMMTNHLKSMGIPHRLKIKGGKPAGMIISAPHSESFGSDTQVTFDNMFDMLVAMGHSPDGRAAEYNHKLSDKQKRRLERKHIRQTGEDWRGMETTVEEFNLEDRTY